MTSGVRVESSALGDEDRTCSCDSPGEQEDLEESMVVGVRGWERGTKKLWLSLKQEFSILPEI